MNEIIKLLDIITIRKQSVHNKIGNTCNNEYWEGYYDAYNEILNNIHYVIDSSLDDCYNVSRETLLKDDLSRTNNPYME